MDVGRRWTKRMYVDGGEVGWCNGGMWVEYR